MQSNIHIPQATRPQAGPPDYLPHLPSDDSGYPPPDYTSQVYNTVPENTNVSKQTGFLRSSRSKFKKFWDKTEIGKSSGSDNTKHFFFQPNTSPATH